MRTPSLLCLLPLLLAACGGHDRHDDASTPMPPAATGSTAAPDPFVVQVAAVTATQPDDTEPAALDATVPSMPENTEPAPLMP